MEATDRTPLHGWIQQLQNRGHIASKQRILIMEALFEQREIMDMENFWIALRQKHRVSWATFYNFIRLAVKENWIAKNSHATTCARYRLLV